MFKKRKFSYVFLLVGAIAYNSVFAEKEATEQKPLTEYVSSQYLATMFGQEEIVEAKPIDENSLSFIEKIKYNIDKKYDTQKQILTPRETQKIAFDLVTTTSTFQETIFDLSCIEKLEIISTNANQQQSLLNIIFNNINTNIGKAYTVLT